MLRTMLTALLLFALTTTSSYGAFGRTKPVYNVNNMTVRTGTGTPATLQQVHDAIVVGATQKGWLVRDEGPGHIVAQIFVRSHMAEVDITFDATKFSINYKNSENLLYDGTVIHRNYNKWIQFMIDKIAINLRRY
ncbi:MAG: hypothetical protein P1U84_06165 [Parvibaculaceae bacterium]|nr:hypothetical protein [Parvibaculaceae bacterium]